MGANIIITSEWIAGFSKPVLTVAVVLQELRCRKASLHLPTKKKGRKIKPALATEICHH